MRSRLYLTLPLPLFVSLAWPFECLSQNATTSVRDVTPRGITRAFRPQESIDEPVHPTHAHIMARYQSRDLIKAGDVVFRIYGIELPPIAEICHDRSGARWTCGRRASLALRSLVDRQQLSCTVREKVAPAPSMICRGLYGDITLLMLQTGWARIRSDVTEPQYVSAAKRAETNGLGVWSREVPTSQFAPPN